MTARARTASFAAVVLLAAAAGIVATRLVGGDTHRVSNLAYVDAAASTQVTNDVTQAVQAVFSVNPKRIAATRRQAHSLLVGSAMREYDKLYGPILSSAPAQGLALTTTVRAAGLTWLHQDEARLLVLADQAGRTTAGQSNAGPAQLDVHARLVDGKWQIADFALL